MFSNEKLLNFDFIYFKKTEVLYNNKKIIGIIPARYGSTRLPSKPLSDISGKPLIQWVYEGSKSSKYIDKIIIATDNTKIVNACNDFNAECVLTDENIQTGSDRILSAYKINDEAFDYIINIQGDEPLITGIVLDELIESTIDENAPSGTLITDIASLDELYNENVVKVILDSNQNAIYFSRQAIPFLRDIEAGEWINHHKFKKHIGIYIYKTCTLELFCRFNQTPLEKMEKLEQLRLLENGIDIFCHYISDFMYSIDTPKDLEFINYYLRHRDV